MRKRNTLRIIHIASVGAILVVLVLVFFMLIENDVFASAPSIEVKPDNCYEETLHIVTDNDYIPYSFYDADGNMSGHDVEAVTLIANEMHMNLDISFAPWNEATKDFVSGKYDALLTCDYFDMFEGADKLLKTDPLSVDEFVVYSKSKVKSSEELYQKKIAIMENANVLPYIHMLGLDNNCLIYSSNRDAMIAVQNGAADCAVMRYTVGEAILKNLNCRDVSARLSLGQSYICIDVAGDNEELVRKLDSAIKTLKANGELERLHNKWLTSFVHEYSFGEVLYNNIWLLGVFVLLIVVVLFIFMRNEQSRIQADAENSARIMALEDNFESLYDVELSTGRYDCYIKGEIFGDISLRMVNSNSFYEDTEKNLGVVCPEDRERVMTALNPDNIRYCLEESSHFDCFYRIWGGDRNIWARMRVLYKDENRKNVIIGVFNAEEEMNAKINAEQSRKQQIARMAGGVSSYIVNPLTERFVILNQDEHLAVNYREDEDFYTSITRYIAEDVFAPDRKKATKGLSLDTMMEHLEKEDEYTFRFRDISSGVPRWYELRAVKISDCEILYGFTDKDDEIVSSLIFDKLEKDFFAMFCLNIDSETIKVVKDGPGLIAPAGKTVPFRTLIDRLGNDYQEEVAAFLDNNNNIENVKQRFATEDKSVILYKSHLENGTKWATVTEFVISRHEDGSPSLVAICFSLLDEEAGEKENLKQELKNARDAAEAANKSKTNFLFNMSHDIRTPMNAITGFTTMAKKYIDDQDRVYEYLQKIDTSGQQLLSLINQVLEMARIESGRIELDENHVRISDEYDALTTVFTEQAKVNELEFNHKLVNITHDYVYADQARVSSVILNIIGNAMKYTPKGGKIDFLFTELEPQKEGFASYVLTVADTGIGMSEEYLKVLFDPFTREKSSTVSKIQGTGLGMSIVKDLVDIMGGSIEVQSKLGQGTRFDVYFDFRIDNEHENPGAETPMTGKISLNGYKALLVDDNELNREIALDILGEEGLDVDTAEDGSMAVEIMREKGQNYYDFILMDIQMPIMNGFDATKEIKRMYPDIKAPIIALSANAFSEDKEASLRAGMDEHVAKPIKINELVSVLAKYL